MNARVFLTLLPLAMACGGSDPTGPTTPTVPDSTAFRAFDRLWNNFDRDYSFFVVKGIDWDATRTRHRSRLSAGMPPSQLWSVMTDVLEELQDGHVWLESAQFGRWSYTGWYDRYPENFNLDVVRDAYAGGELRSTADGHLLFGRVADDIGYVYIPDFGGSDWRFIETLGENLGDVRAVVIDIRNNGGGNDQNGRQIARHFADQRRHFRTIRWRNGPEHDDFDPPIEDFIEPSGAHFAGPVALLTNRRVFSSAEGFVLMMRVIPSVTVVGDTTGGGSGNPQQYTLTNSWRHTVSRWWVQTPEGASFEGVGLAPDVAVQASAADLAAGRDPILERALELLQAQGGGGG